ncbi:MAG: hypothetical protein H6Q08_3038 [Acidobacteria bacterium]|jgi:hypothetical protein|nr:hypothetical protein [Acidobacteriota bacterium]
MGLRLRIVEPEAAVPSDADLTRLFRRRGITRRRRARLRALPKILATHGNQVLGLAAYDLGQDDLRVHELACAPDSSFSGGAVMGQLLEWLELAAVAGGARRVVILPWAVPAGMTLDWAGYSWAGLRARGLEKRLL